MEVPSSLGAGPEAAPPSPAQPAPTIPAHRPNLGPVLLIIVLLGLAGGSAYGGYKVYKGELDIPFLSKPPSLTALAASFKSVHSARLDTTARLAVEKREIGVQAIDLSALKRKKDAEKEAEKEAVKGPGDFSTSIGLGPAPSSSDRAMSVLQGIPDDSEIKVNVVTDWSREGAGASSETSVKGTYAASGVTLAFDLDSRQLETANYVRVNEAPAILVDFSPISETWVKLPKGDGKTGAEAFSLFGETGGDRVFKTTYGEEASEKAEEKKEEKRAGALAEFTEIFSEAVMNGAIKVKKTDDKASVAGRPAYKMTLSIDPEALRRTIQTLIEKRQEKFPDATKFDLLTEETLKGWDNDLLAGWTTEVFIDKKAKTLAAINVSAIFVFDEDDAPKLKDNQVKASVTVEFSRIDQPVSIEAPSDPISLMQAMNRILGRTDEEFALDEQKTNVDDLREALDVYKAKNGGYPDSLDALVGFSHKPYEDLEFSSESMKATVKTVVLVPNDLFTGQGFAYRKTETGYELKYEMHGVEDQPKYVEGTNTATESELSVGAEGAPAPFSFSPFDDSASSGDADDDGLSDADEREIGTDPSKKDTDGDGYDDPSEIEGGYDPLTDAATGLQATVIISERSRDSARVARIKQLQTAFELYFADQNRYPAAPEQALLGVGMTRSLCSGGFEDFCAAGETTYMRRIPLVPTPADGDCSASDNLFSYDAPAEGMAYTLTFCLGGKVGDLDPGKRTADPNGIH